MLYVLELRLHCGHFGSILQNEVIEVLVVVDLVDEVIDTWRGMCSTALEWLWADDLAIVDNQLLVE